MPIAALSAHGLSDPGHLLEGLSLRGRKPDTRSHASPTTDPVRGWVEPFGTIYA